MGGGGYAVPRSLGEWGGRGRRGCCLSPPPSPSCPLPGLRVPRPVMRGCSCLSFPRRGCSGARAGWGGGEGRVEGGVGTCVCGRLCRRFLWLTQTHQQGNKREEKGRGASFHDAGRGWLPPPTPQDQGAEREPPSGVDGWGHGLVGAPLESGKWGVGAPGAPQGWRSWGAGAPGAPRDGGAGLWVLLVHAVVGELVCGCFWCHSRMAELGCGCSLSNQGWTSWCVNAPGATQGWGKWGVGAPGAAQGGGPGGLREGGSTGRCRVGSEAAAAG